MRRMHTRFKFDWSLVFFFFFQAEDGIRDSSVTGVQTVLFRSPDREQDRCEGQVGIERARPTGGQPDQPETDDEPRGQRRADEDPDHSCRSELERSRLARNTPPITAARSSTPTTSNGRTDGPNRAFATSAVFVSPRSGPPPHVVDPIARSTTTSRTTAATAAGPAWVWNARRGGAGFAWVSINAQRPKTPIAPNSTR